MLKKINIGIRLWIGFSLILLLFTFVSLFIINRMESVSDLTSMMYRHPLAVSNAVLRIDADIVRIHRSMKDVVLAENNAEIDEAVQIVNRHEEHIYKDFKIISERFLGSKKMYENARKAFKKWKLIRDEVISLMRQGKKYQAATITKGKGARHVDKLSDAMLALNEFAQNKAGDFLNNTLKTRAETLSVAYTVVIVTILAGIIFVMLFTWSISNPLSVVMNAVLEISMGNLDKKITVKSDDEISQIAKAFNSMAGKLKKSYEELEEKVRTRTDELAEANRELKKEISEHMRTEEELRLHAQASENMLESVNIVRADNGVFIYTNPAFDKMFGYERNEMLGRHVSLVNAPTDKSPEDTAKEIISVLNYTGLWEGEVRNIKKDGTMFLTHAKVSAFNHSAHGSLWISVQEDITDRRQAEDQVKASLREKEILLRELYHRTKNNMQVIRSMLSLQSSYIKDENVLKIFQETENRIQSMALVHHKLYQTKDLSNISLKEYISELGDILLESYSVQSDKVLIVSDMDDVSVLIDTAVPCGLIVNELISNSLKHAFPEDMKGEIRIRLCRTDQGEILIRISDNGVGVPEGFDFRETKTLGLETIFGIGEIQLEGEVIFDTSNGVACQIRFKDTSYEPRV